MPHSQEGEGISVGAGSLGLIKKTCCRCPGFGSFWGAKVTFFSTTNVHPFTCFHCHRVVGHFFKAITLLRRHVYLEYLINFEIFI
jgi:DNA-directed RNA polymerase subunit N (RpoN/RPB10)